MVNFTKAPCRIIVGLIAMTMMLTAQGNGNTSANEQLDNYVDATQGYTVTYPAHWSLYPHASQAQEQVTTIANMPLTDGGEYHEEDITPGFVRVELGLFGVGRPLDQNLKDWAQADAWRKPRLLTERTMTVNGLVALEQTYTFGERYVTTTYITQGTDVYFVTVTRASLTVPDEAVAIVQSLRIAKRQETSKIVTRYLYVTDQVARANVLAPANFRLPFNGTYTITNGPGEGLHTGTAGGAIDYAMNDGTPVRATEQGSVTFSSWDGSGYGSSIMIRHPNGLDSWYAHLQTRQVALGNSVSHGQQIALSGRDCTPSCGPHLHFHVKSGSTPTCILDLPGTWWNLSYPPGDPNLSSGCATYPPGGATNCRSGARTLSCGGGGPPPRAHNMELWLDAGYTGALCYANNAGSYNMAPGCDDLASSFRILPGWSARLFKNANFSGTSRCLNADDSNFTDNTFEDGSGMNDQVSSVILYSNNSCSGAPPPTNTPVPSTPTNTPVPAGQWHVEYFGDMNLGGRCYDGYETQAGSAYVFKDFGIGSPGGGCPSDNWSSRFTRTINFQGGTYRFHCQHDDGCRLYIDGQLRIDAWWDCSFCGHDWSGNLSSGNHEVKVEHFDRGGDAALEAWWQGPGFLPSEASCDLTQWCAQYFGNNNMRGTQALQVLEGTGFIDHQWGSSGPGSGMPSDNFSTRWNRMVNLPCGTYQFNVRSDDGVRLRVNNQMLLDNWNSPTNWSGQTGLPGGTIQIYVEYNERGGDASIRVDWQQLTSCTATPTNTPILPPTNTSTYTPTSTPTDAPTQTPTLTTTNTSTNTSTSTSTPSNTSTQTPTSTSISTNTPTNAPTNTPTRTNTLTPTNTATSTVTATSTPSCVVTPNYAITLMSGVFVPGTSRVPGSGCSTCVVTIPIPFPYQFYENTYHQVNASNKGVLQFLSNNSSGANSCLPSNGHIDAIYAYWDDLNTYVNDNMGIYTSVSGTAPNRIFNIEWRAGMLANDVAFNFEVRLYEGQPRFDVVYANAGRRGFSATIGVQKGSGERFTQYSCNTPSIQTGNVLVFDQRSCPTSGVLTK